MTELREAAEMALEFVDWLCGDDHSVRPKHKAPEITEALRQALDYPTPEQIALAQQIRPKGKSTIGQALAQPEQEPVVHPVVHLWDCICNWAEIIANDGKDANLSPPDWLVDAVKLATAPSKREWIELTDEEIWKCYNHADFKNQCRAVEAKLKEKNQ